MRVYECGECGTLQTETDTCFKCGAVMTMTSGRVLPVEALVDVALRIVSIENLYGSPLWSEAVQLLTEYLKSHKRG